MTRLESYGDRLRKNDYRCHSRFRRAVNFFDGRSMVALVDRGVGPGPHHVIISGIDPQKIENLTVSADGLLVDGAPYPFEASCRYDSGVDPGGAVDHVRFAANLEHFDRRLRQSAKPKSLAFLLAGKPEQRRRSALERSVAERLRAGSEMVFSPGFLGGIKMVRGVGFGLTPGGDDFIGGLLLALHCGQKIFRRDFAPAIRAAYTLAVGRNPFSNMLLAQASQGRAIAKIKDLLAALVGGGENDVDRCAKELRSIGYSSGIDFGTGLLLALQKLNRTEGEKWW